MNNLLRVLTILTLSIILGVLIGYIFFTSVLQYRLVAWLIASIIFTVIWVVIRRK